MDKDRLDRAAIALHDHGSRDGATKSSVVNGMKRDGFTLEEIAAAAQEMNK